jgi:hypothetical protein
MDALRLAGLDLSKEFRLTRTAPAVEAGLRGGIGMSVPIFLGIAAGQPAIGITAALGCWFTLLADIGGTYGQSPSDAGRKPGGRLGSPCGWLGWPHS